MRDEIIERGYSAMQNALRHIARARDCDYYDFPKERPTPCDCAVCTAKSALNTEQQWRYIGARNSRLEHNPRERKIVSAWAKYMTDSKLMAILEENVQPSMRDWFIATTIVQWLATNVGMGILEEAGFKYTQYDKDRKEQEVKGYL